MKINALQVEISQDTMVKIIIIVIQPQIETQINKKT